MVDETNAMDLDYKKREPIIYAECSTVSKPKYDVSVSICTYNPQKEQLLETIQSILEQIDIRVQIIIADDGSEIDYFDEAKQYMDDMMFYDYKFIKSTTNKGIVINFINAVAACDSDYIKAISPGDMLFSKNTLKRWLDAVKEAGYEWSFGDAVYYINDQNGQKRFLKKMALPKDVSVYRRKNFFQCRVNYLINNDHCLGAATLGTKKIMQKYLDMLAGKVIYGEDNIFRLMMMDGIVPLYYHNAPIIYYEFGTGISTSGDKMWAEQLKKDGNITFEIILRHCEELIATGELISEGTCHDGFTALGNAKKEIKLAHRVKRAIILNSLPNKAERKLKKVFCKDMLFFFIKTKLKHRRTTIPG